MSTQVEFYYDYGSPTAYLAWTQLPGICAAHDGQLANRPVLLGGIFKALKSTTPVAIEPKGAWMFDDIQRFAKRYDVPFNMNPHFIVNTIAVMRGAVWADALGMLEPYNKAMFEAMWVDRRNMADPSQITAVLRSADFDPSAFKTAIQDSDVKTKLISATEAAVARGLFGVPTMLVDGEMHFGQDRVDWVSEALQRVRS